MRNQTLTHLALACTLTLAACASPGGPAPTAQSGEKPKQSALPEAQQQEANLFIVFNEDLGRYYIFGDPALYQLYLSTGEVALSRASIGEGPEGSSLIFAMNKEDAKRGGPTPAERLYKGEVTPTGPFYGEVLKGGRYYVFFQWKDMADYLKHGEVPLTYTEIGAGPADETVIYALNKDTAKQGRPLAAIERFHALHPKQPMQAGR